jgi:hypothetical protein
VKLESYDRFEIFIKEKKLMDLKWVYIKILDELASEMVKFCPKASFHQLGE